MGKIAFGSAFGEFASIEAQREPGSADDVSKLIFRTSWATGAGGDGANKERMRINPNGNVGIGTTTPQAKFHLNTNGSNSNPTTEFTGDMIIQGNPVNRTSTTGASLEFVIPANLDGSNPWGQARIITVAGDAGNWDATGKMILGTRRSFDKGTGTGVSWNYGDDLVIDGVGSIGIGTTNPNGYKLAVKGNVHAQQVNVDLNNWADYVFNKKYILRPLSEVKTYIDQNHHLPDMPSAAEVEKDGLNLGEMNKVLTKKVEELTLYLIEKDFEIKNQKVAFAEQQSKIENLTKDIEMLKLKIK